MWVSRATYNDLILTAGRWRTLCEEITRRSDAYKAEIDRILGERDNERKRAENAIDELLAVRGIGPVTPPTPQAQPKPRDFFAEDPAEVQRIHERLKADGLMETLLTEVTT